MSWVGPAASVVGGLMGGNKGSTSSASSVSVQEVSQGWDFGGWTVSTGGGDANAGLPHGTCHRIVARHQQAALRCCWLDRLPDCCCHYVSLTEQIENIENGRKKRATKTREYTAGGGEQSVFSTIAGWVNPVSLIVQPKTLTAKAQRYKDRKGNKSLCNSVNPPSG